MCITSAKGAGYVAAGVCLSVCLSAVDKITLSYLRILLKFAENDDGNIHFGDVPDSGGTIDRSGLMINCCAHKISCYVM